MNFFMQFYIFILTQWTMFYLYWKHINFKSGAKRIKKHSIPTQQTGDNADYDDDASCDNTTTNTNNYNNDNIIQLVSLGMNFQKFNKSVKNLFQIYKYSTKEQQQIILQIILEEFHPFCITLKNHLNNTPIQSLFKQLYNELTLNSLTTSSLRTYDLLPLILGKTNFMDFVKYLTLIYEDCNFYINRIQQDFKNNILKVHHSPEST